MSDPAAATRRRAELRGRESVARWRIESGVWGARLMAVAVAAPALIAIVARSVPGWLVVAADLLASLAVLAAAEAVKRGSRAAAVALLAALVLWRLLLWVEDYQPLWRGAALTAVVLFCLTQGVWGTFALAAAREARRREERERGTTA